MMNDCSFSPGLSNGADPRAARTRWQRQWPSRACPLSTRRAVYSRSGWDVGNRCHAATGPAFWWPPKSCSQAMFSDRVSSGPQRPAYPTKTPFACFARFSERSRTAGPAASRVESELDDLIVDHDVVRYLTRSPIGRCPRFASRSRHRASRSTTPRASESRHRHQQGGSPPSR